MMVHESSEEEGVIAVCCRWGGNVMSVGRAGWSVLSAILLYHNQSFFIIFSRSEREETTYGVNFSLVALNN